MYEEVPDVEAGKDKAGARLLVCAQGVSPVVARPEAAGGQPER